MSKLAELEAILICKWVKKLLPDKCRSFLLPTGVVQSLENCLKIPGGILHTSLFDGDSLPS